MPQWQPGPRVAGPAISGAEVVVEAPPDVPRAIPPNPMMRLLPVLMLVAVVGMTVLFVRSGAAGARNPATLLFPAMMVMSSIGMMAYGGRGARTADVDESRKDYLRYLLRLRDDVVKDAGRQRDSVLWQHPDPAALWTLAGTARMWERDRADSDFCHVRVGLGSQRAATRLVLPELGPIDQLEPVGAAALRDFLRAHSTVGDLPIALALARFAVVEVDGDDVLASGLLRAMLCQLAMLHGPASVAIVAVTDEAAGDVWDWLKWLPHHQHRRLVDAAGTARMQYRRLADAAPVVDGSHAHTVVVVDGGEIDVANRLTGRDDVTILTRGSSGPAERTTLRLKISRDELAVVGDVDEVFARPDILTVAQADACARRLARYGPLAQRSDVRVDGGWADLLGVGDPATLEPTIAWHRRGPQRRLRVPIGVSADGSTVELDLKEAAESGMGPHGLCVGATGSGKSEFLRTLTLGLVATHPPDALNLILVDFKGGATFFGFERARHVAALITNLSGEAHLVARMKDALAGELTRRQELLRAGRFSSVADYERARAGGAKLAPLPALVVIVDEFSELLDQHPDFTEMFVAIGRLGRSLRIHLLLATQRLDEGRLRGLESHLSYRICLKTFSASESRAVIGVADAFHLPTRPGAAYLRVGSDEPVAFQTAYASASYIADHRDNTSTKVARVQRFTSAPSGPTLTEAPVRTGRTVVATVLDRLAERGPAAHRVWLPPLAESPTLDALLTAAGGLRELTVPIGVTDKPFEQRRDPLLVGLAGSAGNVAVVGAPQSGKSTTMRTLVLALSATHSPDQVQFYCLDFGGGSLSSLAAVPHVGAVAGRGDADLVRRSVAEVAAVLRSREAAFRRLGVDSMEEYRRRRGVGDPDAVADPFGDVFLVVDGWASLREEFEALEASITAMAAQGLSFGVHVVLAASRWAEIRPALKDQIGTRIELRLGDAADSELNRKAAQHVPLACPGRGITRAGQHMLVALPRLDGKPANTGLSPAIADAAATIRGRFGERAAPRVRLLPDRVDHAEMIAGNPGNKVMLGVDEDELAPVAIDLHEQQHLVILGDNECGKTAMLRLLCTELLRSASPQQAQLMIVDYRRTLLGVVESEHLAGYAMSAAVLDAQLPAFLDRLKARIPGADVDQRQLRARSWWSGPHLYLIVDDYDLVATAAGNPLLPVLELLPHAKDLGLHVILARRSGGAGRALFEPLLARVREMGCAGLMMSASPDEGVLLGAARPGPLPPGRARFITRANERVVQLAWVPPCQ